MHRVGLALLVLAVVCVAQGCGSKTYEDRLERTTAYYEFIERLNRNLSNPYADHGVVLRTPKQFTPVPKPRRPARSSENETNGTDGQPQEGMPEDTAFGNDPDELDPRLPDHIDFQLPGLLEVWSADLNTFSSGSGSSQTARGYLYLMGNYDYWRTYKSPQEIGKPLDYYKDLRDALSAGLEVPIDPKARGSATDRVNKWYSEIVPAAADADFASQKEFTAITLVPEPRRPSLLDDEPEEPAAPREYQLYLYANGDMQIALLFDLPRDISAGEDLPERILLSLLSVDVSSEKPRGARRAPGGAGEDAPATPPPGGANF